MKKISGDILSKIESDLDAREELIREIVYETLAGMEAPDLSEHLVATYFVWTKNLTPARAGEEISYHMTTAVRHPEPGSLLAECTGEVVASVSFDKEERCGLVRVAYPLKMLLRDGILYSTDVLHIIGGAGAFALRENRDVKLVNVAMSDEVMAKFPGPAYGGAGVRKLADFPPDKIAFGTILKPTSGITPEEEADIVYQAASNPLFLFIKEDENYMPRVSFADIRRRARTSAEAISRAKEKRGDVGLVFACHVTSPPQLLEDCVQAVLDAGLNGVMFSEYYTGGTVRMVREMTKGLANPPAIYGHNGGISAMTRHIYREVLDMFARLDGIDFRQTAPVTSGEGLLRPFGLEWRKCEEMLTKPMAGKPGVMIARAGGLDQGNIIHNLLDIEANGDVRDVLFLAGSAINSIKNDKGLYDPAIGARAMEEVVSLYEEKAFSSPDECTVTSLKAEAKKRGYKALTSALEQRYGE